MSVPESQLSGWSHHGAQDSSKRTHEAIGRALDAYCQWRSKPRLCTWFEDRLDALKAEYDISPSDDYAVEGVIVVSRPRIWMYSHAERLPVVDERNFFRTLKAGERFQTAPVNGWICKSL